MSLTLMPVSVCEPDTRKRHSNTFGTHRAYESPLFETRFGAGAVVLTPLVITYGTCTHMVRSILDGVGATAILNGFVVLTVANGCLTMGNRLPPNPVGTHRCHTAMCTMHTTTLHCTHGCGPWELQWFQMGVTHVNVTRRSTPQY